ncbi:hypothetical protein Q9L58_007749, partial [Maublancomyces gigas]
DFALFIGVHPEDSFNTIITMNAVGILGRLLPNYLADRYFGCLNVFAPITIITGVIVICWMAVDSYSGLTAFIVVCGIFAAGVQALFPASVAALTNDPRKAGTRIGMSFTVVSLGCAVGAPISGALVGAMDGSFRYAQIFCGLVLILGGLSLGAARVAKTGLILRAKT